MRPGAHAQAAIDILESMETRRRPAAEAIREWMLTHRFAGSSDRAQIGDIVFAALRWANSSGWRLESDTPRARVLGALRWGFEEPLEALEALSTDRYGPAPLNGDERAALADFGAPGNAPAWVAGDYPEWLDGELSLIHI